MDSGPSVWLYLLELLIVVLPTTLLHELGHAVAARRLLPGRVAVVLGDPRRGRRFVLLGVEYSLAPVVFPFGIDGVCIHDGRPTARQALAISLAGPAAAALGFAAALALLPHVGGVVRSFVWMSVFLQGADVLLNLVPFTVTRRRGGPALASDGKNALDALRRLAA